MSPERPLPAAAAAIVEKIALPMALPPAAERSVAEIESATAVLPACRVSWSSSVSLGSLLSDPTGGLAPRWGDGVFAGPGAAAERSPSSAAASERTYASSPCRSTPQRMSSVPAGERSNVQQDERQTRRRAALRCAVP